MSQPDPYRPVSGLAVVGFLLALLFTLAVGLAAAIALYHHQPLQIDIGWLVLPLGAAGLSAAGLLQIRRSGGGRAGGRLARWGLGLSVVVTLGYLVYQGGTEAALREQSSSFAERWFAALQAGRTYPAFWATLDPEQRDPGLALTPELLKEQPAFADRLDVLIRAEGQLTFDSPGFAALTDEFPAARQAIESFLDRRYSWNAAGQPGRLAVFQDHPLITLVERWRGQAQVEPQGIRSWRFVQGRYLVELGYRLRTPEGHIDAVVTLLASQAAADPRRQWQVLLPDTGLVGQLTPTPIGTLAQELSISSRRFAADWLDHLAQGRRDEANRATLPPTERTTGQDRRADLLDVQGLKADEAIRPIIVAHGQALLKDAQTGIPGLLDPPVGRLPASWRIEGDRVIFVHPFLMRIAPRYICEGSIEVATADLGVVTGLREGGAILPANLGWWVQSLKLRVAGMAK